MTVYHDYMQNVANTGHSEYHGPTAQHQAAHQTMPLDERVNNAHPSEVQEKPLSRMPTFYAPGVILPSQVGNNRFGAFVNPLTI